MLSKEQIKTIAEKYVHFNEIESGIQLIIVNEHTIEKSYGTIFSFNSKLYIETSDFIYAIAGNAPFLVEKNTGRVVQFGTSEPLEYYIKAYKNNTLVPCSDRYWYHETESYG